MKYPTTPDGRYFVVKTTLWRSANPNLSPERRSQLQKELMNARRQCRKSNLATKTPDEVKAIRKQVDDAKVALGERGPIWWDDDEGVGDLNRHSVNKSPYREWFAGLGKGGGEGDEGSGSEAEAHDDEGEEEEKPKRTAGATGKTKAKAKMTNPKPTKTKPSAEGKTRTAKKYSLRSAHKGAAKEESGTDD